MDYSLEDIKVAWKQYEEAQAFSVLKDGKWKDMVIEFDNPLPKPEGTACKIDKLSKVMDFPEFLEKHYK